MITNKLPLGNVSNLLPAQKKTLRLIIVVVIVVYVGEQRRDTYYRNDPKKYGLNKGRCVMIIYSIIILVEIVGGESIANTHAYN